MGLIYPIDENGSLTLELEADKQRLTGGLRSNYARDTNSESSLTRNILPLMTLVDHDKHKPQNVEHAVTLTINDHPFADFAVTNNTVTLKKVHRKLSVFEARCIGRAPQTEAPVALNAEMLAGLDKYTPVTDLHTHLSTQVSADDLIDIGKKQGTLYPTTMLRMYNKLSPDSVPFSRKNAQTIARRPFLPMAHMGNAGGEEKVEAIPLGAITPEGLDFLKAKMRMSPETQGTFGQMESTYHLREPLTKNIKLLPDILWAVGKNYDRQGIRYAELSSTEILDPAWLKVIHDVVPEIEKQTKNHVALRFKAGFPRTLGEDDIARRIERYKRIAISPYIVGADLLGYEVNKTNKVRTQLTGLAKWMEENQPGDVLQIHAGENNKNQKNVREALQLASENDNLLLHLGHAIYGMDEATRGLALELSKEGKLIVQCNLDSNLALNNIDFPKDAKIAALLKENIPCVLGSDGADAYSTNARQLAMSAMLCGVTPEGFAKIRKTEEAYIERQKLVFSLKAKMFESRKREFEERTGEDFFASPPKSPPMPPKKDYIPAIVQQGDVLKQLNAKLSKSRPIYFAGAGGTSWEPVVSEASKGEFRRGVARLLERMDPEKFYIVQGRKKSSGGVAHEVEAAVEAYNRSHDKKFYCVSLESENNGNGTHKDASEYIRTLHVDFSLVQLTNAVMNFLKDRDGFAFFAGGKSFTRDLALMASEKGIPFGLMQDMNGASQEKARIYKDHAFTGADGMVEYAEKAHLLGPDAKGQTRDKSSLPGGEMLFGYFFIPARPQGQTMAKQ